MTATNFDGRTNFTFDTVAWRADGFAGAIHLSG